MCEIKKNTVEAENQLQEFQTVTFRNITEKPSIKFMFVGNSITLHDYKEEIGWNGCYGMAASCEENDYVHVFMREVEKKYSDTAYCICQASKWEINYKNGEEVLELYKDARNYGADVIIMRIVDNCSTDDFDENVFEREYDKLLNYLNPQGKAKIILTSGFWKHPADIAIRSYAKKHNIPMCELSDLGEEHEMKAIGRFEHGGVANHPGDLGMKKIAERLLEAYLKAYEGS